MPLLTGKLAKIIWNEIEVGHCLAWDYRRSDSGPGIVTSGTGGETVRAEGNKDSSGSFRVAYDPSHAHVPLGNFVPGAIDTLALDIDGTQEVTLTAKLDEIDISVDISGPEFVVMNVRFSQSMIDAPTFTL